MTIAVNGTDAVDTGAQGEPRHQLVVGPNASLSGSQAALFMLWMCALCFGIAGMFAWRSYWRVFPFAGLWWSLHGNAYREVISIGSDRLLIETGRRRPEHCWDFPRAWARLKFEPEIAADRSHL